MRNVSGNISLTFLPLKHVKDSILFILLFFLLLAKVLGGHGPCFIPLMYNKHIPDTLQVPV